MKIRSILEKLLLMFVACIFCFALIEIFFRILYPQSGYSLKFAPWGWTHVPNTRVTYYTEVPQFHFNLAQRHYPIPIRYNSKGLRELEYGYEKEKNVFRILVIGDSWAEDMGSFFENLHTKWLERKLNKLVYPYRFEVIDAGHYAFDNANEYMFYQKEGKKYHPDLVMVMYTTDTASPDYATLENGELKLHYKNYTTNQRVYREFVSFVRRTTQFGSFLLNRIDNLKGLKNIMIKRGLKESDKIVPRPEGIAPAAAAAEENGFSEVDKKLWIAFNNEVTNDGGRFVFINCAHYPDSAANDFLKPADREFLIKNSIHVLDIESTKEKAKKLKASDIQKGTYDHLYESHRFGYKMNEKVADTIIDYLITNKYLEAKGN
ncbi:MAG TPA: hypothetical protein PKL77_09080 [Candidatus Omnitrophota bacterium]|nr:hypothetical protein [Candidatus Omnitrophota bacterium]